MEKLDKAVREAESIYLHRVIQLAKLQHPNHPRPITFPSVRAWLESVLHNPNGKHRRPDRNYATAYYTRQEIIYNPKWVEQADELALLDIVLHELGHLFAFHFLGSRGHDHKWKSVGHIVGYAPVGSSSLENRKRHRSYAAHAGAVPVHERTIGRFGQTERKRHMSAVDSPVARAWEIFEQYPWAERKEVLAYCVQIGINPNTASTQYARWKNERLYR